MRKIAGFLLVSLSVVGCMPGAGDESDESGDEVTAEAEDTLVSLNAINPNAINPNAINPNAINPNAINPNAINPNAINPNAINPNSLSPSAMTALQDPGEAGDLSRMFMKYLVSCAFNSTQSFSFSWTDAQSVVHDENYVGAVALAPDWATRGSTESEQRWVTACLASRTNYYSTTVLISMRGGHASLGADSTERSGYSAREGAFWGNLFAAEPHVYSCYDAANVANSRAKLRDCAAGHVSGESTVECGPIDITGACDDLVGQTPRCATPSQSGDGFPSCSSTTEVVTTFLPPP